MKRLIFYLLSLLLFAVSCSKSKEKVLFPTKVKVGSTQYEFLYNPNNHNRIYCITTTRPNFYAENNYSYYGDFPSNEPDHKWRDKIRGFGYAPDLDVTGWDGRDSVISKSVSFWQRNEDTLIVLEGHQEQVYKKETSRLNTYTDRYKIYSHDVRHTYNANKKLTGSSYYRKDNSYGSNDTLGVLTRRVAYRYSQGKLAKASFYDTDAEKPYLVIELAYDDKPGYLRNLALEARFLPLELPYRDHNIVSYKVMDAQGRIQKDLSYTCIYTYNRDGYPDTFTRKMFDGRKVEGYMVYRTELKGPVQVAAAN